MSTLDYLDILNILETLYFTDDIEVLYFEQNKNFLFVDAIIDKKAVQMTIDVQTRRLQTATGENVCSDEHLNPKDTRKRTDWAIKIKTEKKG